MLPLSTPFQLVKVIYGLRHALDHRLPVMVMRDTTLMQMDAPVILPAGSMRKVYGLPGAPVMANVSLCARPETIPLRAGEGK